MALGLVTAATSRDGRNPLLGPEIRTPDGFHHKPLCNVTLDRSLHVSSLNFFIIKLEIMKSTS